MEWLFLIGVVWAVAFLCVHVASWCSNFLDGLNDTFEGIEDELRYRIAVITAARKKKANMRRLRQWLAMRAASGSTAPHPDAVAARKQAQFIRQLVDQELPDAIRRCLRTHHVAALGAGANYIW